MVIKILEKIFRKKRNVIQVPTSEIEYINDELFIKPWLYEFNFTFSNKNNLYYSARDCYKEATGTCLLEEKEYITKEGIIEIYNSCLELKEYLKQYPEPKFTLPFLSSTDGKHFSVTDGQHRLCVAIREKIKIYVRVEIPKSILEKFKAENESNI